MLAFSSICSAQFFVGVDASLGKSDIISLSPHPMYKTNLGYSTGINAGYEIIKHIPVSIGVQYSKNSIDIGQDYGISGIRVPVKIGYCHYFGKIRPFANVGIYACFANKNIPYFDINGISVEMELKTYYGYMGQVGIGYKIFNKLLLSVALEYSRPLDDKIEIEYEGPPGRKIYHFRL
jgi:outer membrane protein W